MVLPFRRIKKTNVQSLHWSFGFIEISPLTPSTRPLQFISAPRKAKHFIGQLWQLMTASNVGSRTQAWQTKWVVFKIPGLSASVSFFSSPLPPRSFTCVIFLAVFDSRSSFFSPKPHRNACYAGYQRGNRAKKRGCLGGRIITPRAM